MRRILLGIVYTIFIVTATQNMAAQSYLFSEIKYQTCNYSAYEVVAQTVQFEGVSCVLDTIIELPGGSVNKSVQIDFKYTLDENTTIDALTVLLKEGQIVVGKNKYKATSLMKLIKREIEDSCISTTHKPLPMPEEQKEEIEKNGIVTLTFLIPQAIKVEKMESFLFNKQEFSFKHIENSEAPLATIKVIRRKSMLGAVVSYQVFINDKFIDNVKNGKTLEIPVFTSHNVVTVGDGIGLFDGNFTADLEKGETAEVYVKARRFLNNKKEK